MDAPIRVREEAPTSVAYVRREGPFDGIPGALEVLHRHLEDRGLTPAGPPIGVFFSDPKQVPEARARWEVRWAIAERRADADPGDDDVGYRLLAGRTVAVLVHVGPYDTVARDYERTARWIGEHGYMVVGPPEEAYLSEPDTPPEQIRTEIRFPVARAEVPHPIAT